MVVSRNKDGRNFLIFYTRHINVSQRRKLTDKDKKTLMADLRYAPAWIDNVVRRLNEE